MRKQAADSAENALYRLIEKNRGFKITECRALEIKIEES